MVVFSQPTAKQPESPPPKGGPSVLVIGIGAAGLHFVNVMIVERVRGCRFVGIDTDVASLQQSLAPRNLLIGPSATSGEGTGCDPCRGRRAVMESKDEIHRVVEDAQLVVLVGGLGGGMVSGGASHVARIAREAGASLILGMLTLPGRREAKYRHQYARRALPMLEGSLDTTVLFSNDRLARDPLNRPVSYTADHGAESMAKAFKGVLDLLFLCGRLRTDFADLRACLDSHGYGSLSVGMASGPQRALQATRGALESPLVQTQFLEEAETVFVQMRVGTEMPLLEIDRALALLTARCGPEKRIELSLNQEPAFEGIARCTLLATCPRRQDARVPLVA